MDEAVKFNFKAAEKCLGFAEVAAAQKFLKRAHDEILISIGKSKKCVELLMQNHELQTKEKDEQIKYLESQIEEMKSSKMAKCEEIGLK